MLETQLSKPLTGGIQPLLTHLIKLIFFHLSYRLSATVSLETRNPSYILKPVVFLGTVDMYMHYVKCCNMISCILSLLISHSISHLFQCTSFIVDHVSLPHVAGFRITSSGLFSQLQSLECSKVTLRMVTRGEGYHMKFC